MKFISMLLAIICAINAGFSIGQGNYGFPALNVFLVFLNMSSYNRAISKEESEEE